jgi:membrane protein DedA with SNARE-associated domain
VLVDLTDWVTGVIDRLGYLGVALLVALENVFPPIPSEVVLPFAGFAASDGGASLLGMIVAATIGSVLGAWVLYGISARIGPDRLLALVVRHGRWLRLTAADLAGAEEWFDRRADAAVLLCRCVPLVRSLISIPAGFRRMSLVRFTVLTAIGSATWNTGLIVSGFLLRERWDEIEGVMSVAQYVVLGGFVLAIAWFVRSSTRRGHRSAGAGDRSSVR